MLNTEARLWVYECSVKIFPLLCMLESFHNKNVWASAKAKDLLQDKWIYLGWDGACPSVLYKAPCDEKSLT